ncbi:hypothetical protein D3C81_1328020 [compost metagenome]
MAAEANEEIWPPTLVCLLARSTIAMAFQRVYERMRCSMSWSPGMRACCSTGMVLMYCVSAWNGWVTPFTRAYSICLSIRNAARAGPSAARTPCRASSHSWVSWGSASLALDAPRICSGTADMTVSWVNSCFRASASGAGFGGSTG